MRLTLATHDSIWAVQKFRRSKTLVAGVAVTLSIGLLGAVPAFAAPNPVPPTTSTDAKSAWENSSHQAEIASEQVNGAKQAQTTAARAARQAGAAVVAARTAVTVAQQTAASTSAVVASYQGKLDAFANASFRGASLSQFSVMLTATSANDFLDESTVINRVAQDTHHTLDQAVKAKETAAKAKSAAVAAEAAAALAKTKADQASVAAAAAAVTAQNKKAQLDAAVAQYKELYNRLTAKEKAAAAAAAEKIRQDSLAAAAAAQAQSNAAAAAAKQPAPVNAAPAAAAPANAAFSSSAASSSAASSSAASSSAAPGTTTSASAPVQGGDAAGQAAAALALTKVGFAYVYGAQGPNAFDCSGLTSWVWAQQGVSIPRASYEQANLPSVSLDQLQPGDLVTYYSPVSHVAIYVGNGMVVSAADEQLGVVFRTVSGAGPDATGHRVPRG